MKYLIYFIILNLKMILYNKKITSVINSRFIKFKN